MAIPETRPGNLDNINLHRAYNALDWIATVLLIVGGLNWGTIGFFDTNIVALLVGDMTTAARIIYGLVGLAALYSIYLSTKVNRRLSAPLHTG